KLLIDLKAYSRFTAFDNLDAVTTARTVGEAAIDSLEAYKVLKKRLAEINSTKLDLQTAKSYLDSLVVNLPIPDWLGKGLPWADSVITYGKIRDSIRLLEKTTGIDQTTITRLKTKFQDYKRFHDTLIAYIQSPEKLTAHVPAMQLLQKSSNAGIKEQLENQGTLALLAFAGSAVSSPAINRIIGPLSTLMAFQDSLTKYRETAKKISAYIDTFNMILKDPFTIIDRFPNIKGYFATFNIDPSKINFPPVKALTNEIHGIIAPYASKIQELVNYGDELKKLADEIPGREEFIKNFVQCMATTKEQLSKNFITAKGATHTVTVGVQSDTSKLTAMKVHYGQETFMSIIENPVQEAPRLENSNIITYIIGGSGKHYCFDRNTTQQADAEISTTGINERFDANNNGFEEWQKEGYQLMCLNGFSKIATYISEDRKIEAKAGTDKSLIFNFPDIKKELHFVKNGDNYQLKKFLTETMKAELSLTLIKTIPLITSISFSPITGSDKVEIELSDKEITLER
ncbi:MAG: hypothetical protein JNL74_06835, partial [Fibrobacteres bacterium]|nr:hypothetical protein [Fibrobacterota bacterium]